MLASFRTPNRHSAGLPDPYTSQIVAMAAIQRLALQPTTRMVGLGVTGAIVTMISTILVLNAILTLAS